MATRPGLTSRVGRCHGFALATVNPMCQRSCAQAEVSMELLPHTKVIQIERRGPLLLWTEQEPCDQTKRPCGKEHDQRNEHWILATPARVVVSPRTRPNSHQHDGEHGSESDQSIQGVVGRHGDFQIGLACELSCRQRRSARPDQATNAKPSWTGSALRRWTSARMPGQPSHDSGAVWSRDCINACLFEPMCQCVCIVFTSVVSLGFRDADQMQKVHFA